MHPVPSKAEYHRHTPITVEQNILVPMRDGIRLYADVYRPSGGGRHPVLLQRLPYGKHKPRYRSFYLEPLRAVNRGYVVVLQDVRGRHASEGAFYPYRHEVDDGYDTVEWCASQPWCDGNVGMFGISYHGATQWRRDPHAMSQHLPLKEMPALRGLADYYYDWLDHHTYDAYWKALSPRERFDCVTVPALNIGAPSTR